MILTLKGLRAIAMLGIFLFHLRVLLKGTFPVKFFFMLSGFVIYYSYTHEIVLINIKENIPNTSNYIYDEYTDKMGMNM